MFRWFCFPQVVQEQMLGEIKKMNGRQLCQEYLCQKLLTSDNPFSGYNRKCQDVFETYILHTFTHAMSSLKSHFFHMITKEPNQTINAQSKETTKPTKKLSTDIVVKPSQTAGIVNYEFSLDYSLYITEFININFNVNSAIRNTAKTSG